ncbi:DUF6093 family protein [Nesterenkonia haasae]|uniref:DUF6093 family protein n=1 Tax=Nesterenkonia haasae TaxID=2587813 RepID=UPI0013912E30|nr:DUF6093 family protein [Nesterenkonia haasae]NDK31184.1 hypothetical protein [Nesterenkonia haasae]
MKTQQLLERGRAVAERLMTGTCTITREDPDGETTINPDNGQEIPVTTTVYTGKCKLSSTPATGEQLDSTHHRYLVETPRLHLPHDAQVQSGDDAVITATETGNVSTGISMRLVDLNRGTYRTSQRWNVEVATG